MTAILACAGVIAGCGSTTHVTRTITRAAASASSSAAPTTSATAPSTTVTTAASAPNREASRPARRILEDAAGALGDAQGYAMRGDLIQDHRRLVLGLTTDSATSTDLTISIGASTSDLINLGDADYVRGNSVFWRAQTSARRAAMLAGHWLRLPAAGRRSVTSALGSLAPSTLARCLLEDHGRLSVAGRVRVEGRPGIVIADAGNVPGSAPGEVVVAARGTPYPLRIVASGVQRPGGHIDVCNNGRPSSSAIGTITLSQFGQIPTIQPPQGAQQAPGQPSV